MRDKFNNKKPNIARKRHFAKTISWRIIGTVDTWVISFILVYYFGERKDSATEAASFIAVFELVTKTILYYFHVNGFLNLIRLNSAQFFYIARHASGL